MQQFDWGKKIVHKTAPCCECGRLLNRSIGPARNNEAPRPGDICLCAYCGCGNVVADDLGLRRPTDEEMLEIARDRDIQKMRRAIQTALDEMAEDANTFSMEIGVEHK